MYSPGGTKIVTGVLLPLFVFKLTYFPEIGFPLESRSVTRIQILDQPSAGADDPGVMEDGLLFNCTPRTVTVDFDGSTTPGVVAATAPPVPDVPTAPEKSAVDVNIPSTRNSL
jgi:hypothetical protein